MFITLKQYDNGEQENGATCAVRADKILAIATIVDVENANQRFSRILFENKEYADVQEPVDEIVGTLLKMGL